MELIFHIFYHFTTFMQSLLAVSITDSLSKITISHNSFCVIHKNVVPLQPKTKNTMPTPFSPEIIQLRSDIEKHIGRTLQSPADFEQLIQQIWNKQHRVLSLSTIKRIWGYVESSSMPRLSTLNTLSQFLDYTDWNAYLVPLEQRKESESGMFMGEGVRVSELQVGECIEVTWQPNRHCVFRYIPFFCYL